jgi:hypothetical protein
VNVALAKRHVAAWLWLLWAVVVWNVVFDRVIVVAGRDYLNIARAAVRNGGYAKIDETMRPARSRALWLATASAGAILIVGFLSLRRAGLSGPPTSAEHPRKT